MPLKLDFADDLYHMHVNQKAGAVQLDEKGAGEKLITCCSIMQRGVKCDAGGGILLLNITYVRLLG